MFIYFLASASYTSGLEVSTFSSTDFAPEQFSKATTDAPFVSTASTTFMVAPPMGHPVIKILGFFSPAFPSFSIFSIRASICAGIFSRSKLNVVATNVFIKSVPVMGAGSAFITEYSLFSASLSAFFTWIPRRMSSSVIVTPNTSSSFSFMRMISPRYIWTPLSLTQLGSSIICTGLNSAIYSYIFFFPSQVVSPTTRSEKKKNGHLSVFPNP